MARSAYYRLLLPLLLLLVSTLQTHAQRCDVGIDALELDDCCFDLFITNDEVGLTIGGIQVNVLSPTDTIVSSTQPANWSASRGPRALAWIIGGGLPSGDFEFAGLCMWGSGDGTSRVEFVFRNQAGAVACRDTIDLVCLPSTGTCIELRPTSVECVTLPTGAPGQELTFDVTNLDSCVLTSLTLSVASPSAVTATPASVTLPTPLAIFDSAVGLTVRFSGAGLQGIASLTLAVTANGTGCGCTDSFTVFLANCAERCFDLTTDSLMCRPEMSGVPAYDWGVTFTNQLGCSLTTIGAQITSPPTGVTILPATLPFAPTLATGDSLAIPFRIVGGEPGSTIMVRLTPAGASCSCDSVLRLVLPDCSSPTDTACVRLTSRDVMCDPLGSQGDYIYTFDLHNGSADTIDSLVFMSLTPNVLFDPTPYALPTPLAPSDNLVNATVKIRQGTQGAMTIVTLAFGRTAIVCGDTTSVFLPECLTAVPGDLDAGMTIEVLPNPTHDRADVILHVDRRVVDGILEVVDARGIVVLRHSCGAELEAGDHRYTIDVSSLSVGAYLVRLAGVDRALHRPLRIVR